MLRPTDFQEVNMIRRSLFLLVVFTVALSAQNADWHREFPAFKIGGNLDWGGTADLAIYLSRTPQGNSLINSNFPEDFPLLKKSIYQLGIKYSDTKIILASNPHGASEDTIAE